MTTIGPPKKIGIMGGTFDPIHIGHLIAAEQAREQAKLDEIWFIPTHTPPHKHMETSASPVQRLEMVQAAVEVHEAFVVQDIEIRRGGISYTYDTIEQLTSKWPQHDLFYIIGADMVEHLPNWHRIEELSRKIAFIGLSRPGFTLHTQLPSFLQNRVQLISMPEMNVSSTDIRARLGSGRSIRFLVPDSVYDYIKEKHIYG